MQFWVLSKVICNTFCKNLCICSAQSSMSYMEKRYRNESIIFVLEVEVFLSFGVQQRPYSSVPMFAPSPSHLFAVLPSLHPDVHF